MSNCRSSGLGSDSCLAPGGVQARPRVSLCVQGEGLPATLHLEGASIPQPRELHLGSRALQSEEPWKATNSGFSGSSLGIGVSFRFLFLKDKDFIDLSKAMSLKEVSLGLAEAGWDPQKCFSLFFFWLHLQHMDVPRTGTESEPTL